MRIACNAGLVRNPKMLSFNELVFVASESIFDNLIGAFHNSLAEPILHSLESGERHHTSAVVSNFRHRSARVNHRFGNERVAHPPSDGVSIGIDSGDFSVALSRCSNHGAHIRLVFVGHRLTGAVNHRCSSDIRPIAHVNAVAGYGNECPCRCCIIVDESVDGNLEIDDCRANGVGIIYRSAISVHVNNHRIGFVEFCFVETFLHISPCGRADLVFERNNLHNRRSQNGHLAYYSGYDKKYYPMIELFHKSSVLYVDINGNAK